ncbi:adenylyl cyclase-associated protein 2-like [Tachypleus tridentatus]|uniref:adenylyl cyclase-associated protein 2-like n=1 Tax=Tachypleus tridentatus TaxID=6853 RepID=UPI003FD073DC
MSTNLESLVSRLENVAVKLESTTVKGQGMSLNESVGDSLAPFVVAYDEVLDGSFKSFLSLSAELGKEVQSLAKIVDSAVKAQRTFLVTVSKARQPSQNDLISLLKPTSDQIQAVQDFREKNRASAYFNHLSAVSESIPALGWVTVVPAPAPYVKEMLDAGQFYTNRVLMDYKDKEKTHVDWARNWLQFLQDLQAYIKKYHTTGLIWNSSGCDVIDLSSSLPLSANCPPPPPPPLQTDELISGESSEEGNRAALFKEINQGENITKGLRKITSNQQTHKNPNLRIQASSPYKGPPTTARPFKPYSSGSGASTATSQMPSKPPKMELEGKKWIVEYHQGRKDLVIDQVQMGHVIQVFQCNDCVLVVRGKLNTINIDSCKKTSIVFEDIVSSVEFVNCERIQVQCLGKCPTIVIDKTDGAQLFLNKDSLEAQIVSSKSSEINICIPQPNGDYVEYAVPEQFKTLWTGKGIHTVCVDKI